MTNVGSFALRYLKVLERESKFGQQFLFRQQCRIQQLNRKSWHIAYTY